MSAHTPGPWKLDGDAVSGGGVVIALLDGDNFIADGYLIAAAPELLTALKEAEGYIAYRVSGTGGIGETKVLPTLRAAISKAESA